jgi:hypothetical protein
VVVMPVAAVVVTLAAATQVAAMPAVVAALAPRARVARMARASGPAVLRHVSARAATLATAGRPRHASLMISFD